MQAEPCRGPVGVYDAGIMAMAIAARDVNVRSVAHEIVKRVEGLRAHRSQR